MVAHIPLRCNPLDYPLLVDIRRKKTMLACLLVRQRKSNRDIAEARGVALKREASMVSSHDDQALVPSQGGKEPRERLTPAQRQVPGALAAGYSVFLCVGPWMRYLDQVGIGNGSRLSYATVASLCERELIEEAGHQDTEQERPSYRLIFYRLTPRGWEAVTSQHIRFAHEEIEVPLPHRVEEIRQLAGRYRDQFGMEPQVEMRGEGIEAYFPLKDGRRLWSSARIPKWLTIAPYDDSSNWLGFGEPGADTGTLTWVHLSWHRSGPAKLRLRPAASPENAIRHLSYLPPPSSESRDCGISAQSLNKSELGKVWNSQIHPICVI